MSGYLRQSTAAQDRLIGPFVDDTDFKTAETALTINNTDIKLRANGTTLSNKNAGGGTHQVNGMYSVTWDATDTANVGELYYSVVVAGALQVFGVYTVLEEAVYDALFASAAAGYFLTSSTLTDTNISTALGNRMADHVWRRTYTCARTSTYGDAVNFRSGLGVMGKLVNKVAVTGANLVIYQEDDVTSTAPGGTQAITSTPGADPITALDTA